MPHALGPPALLAALLVVTLVAIGALAMVPPTAAEEHHTNNTTRALSNDLVAPGGSITVETTVRFDEPTSGRLTETVEPPVAGIDVIDADGADTVTVRSDETGLRATYSDRTELTLVYELTIDEDAQEGDSYTIEGTFDNGEQRTVAPDEVTVTEGPIFEVTQFDAPTRVPPGEPFDVELEITNTGREADTQSVDLWLDDQTLGSTDGISLDPGQSTTVRFDERQVDDRGTYRLHAETDQHRRTNDLTVESFAAFEIDEIDAPSTVTVVDEFIVTALVTNVGDLADEQDIHLEIDGERVQTHESTAIEPGSTREVVFEPIRVEEAGEHDIRVVTDNASARSSLTVTEASVAATLEDQIVGVDPTGDRAIAITNVTADAGWSLLVTYENETGTSIVAGMTELEDDVDNASVPVSIEDESAFPGPVEVLVVFGDAESQVGEPLPGDLEVLLRERGTLFTAVVDVHDQSFDDEADTVIIDRAAMFDSNGASETPYIIGVYRVGPDGEGEIVGQSAPLWGEVEGIEIDLDRRLDVEGDHRFVVRLHRAVVGQRGDPIPVLADSSVTTFDEAFTVRVIDTPSFVIEGINRPSDVDADEPLDIDITLTNQGVAAGTKTVWVSIGDWVELVDVTLEPGQTRTITVTWESHEGDPGEYPLLIDTGDDSDLSAIEVNGVEATPTPPSNPIPGLGLSAGLVALAIALLVATIARRRDRR
ncbi:MAG: CARDB domain-containing protein [Halobacteriota archaeon]